LVVFVSVSVSRLCEYIANVNKQTKQKQTKQSRIRSVRVFFLFSFARDARCAMYS
jgi:hypothetical protein